MEALIALVLIAIVIFAIVGFVCTLSKLFETPREDFPVRWCAPCQGMRAFASGRCIVCGCSNAESYRCQIEHCLLGSADARQLGATQRLEAAQVANLERFYLDGLNLTLRQSGTNQNSVAVLARFSQRMAVQTPPAAAQFVAAETPRVLPQVAYARQPAAAITQNEFWGKREAAPVVVPAIKLETRDFTPVIAAAKQADSPPLNSTETAPEREESPEPEVPMAERLTRVLLGMGVCGLAIAALVILTAHDGSFSLLKMLGFAGATAGIFGGGVAFSRWLKLERTAGAFYTLAALFLPLNALAAHAFGVWRTDDLVAHWGVVGLGCACVYAVCARGLRSRVFAILAGVAFIAGTGFSLQAMVEHDFIAGWTRDALFAALPLALGVACAWVMRGKFGRWTLVIPGAESLLALVAGRVIGEEGREAAPARKLENWQLLGMPLRLCADGAALVSGLWLVINVALHGKPALIGFGLGGLELAAFVMLLALGRGWPRLMYATAGVLIASMMAWVIYFGRGEHSLAPVLLGMGALLYAGELAFAKFKRAEFGLPLFHAALALGLLALLLVGAELPRLEAWRVHMSLPALAHSVGSLALGGALAAALFAWWARREGFEWASLPALLGVTACGLIGISEVGLPVHAVLTLLVAIGGLTQVWAVAARPRKLLSEWLGWQAFAFGVLVACVHVGLHAALVATPAQLAWMASSAAGGVALALLAARDRVQVELAGFVGVLLPVGALAALRTLDANVAMAPQALFALMVLAGAVLAMLDWLHARLASRELTLAARSTAIGGALLVALGAALALVALIIQRLEPAHPAALNLALAGGGAFALWQAWRWKQPWLLIVSDALLVPLSVSLSLQAGADWRLHGTVLAALAALHGAALLAPFGREWRVTLLGLGSTLAAIAVVLSLGQITKESSFVPVPALALSAAFFALASVRETQLWLSLAASACAGVAAWALLSLGASLNGLECAAALGFGAALGGCWILFASREERGERLVHWAWALRISGEIVCVAAGWTALGSASVAHFAQPELVSPAIALLIGALGLAAGTALTIARGEESWRAGQGFIALAFAVAGTAFGLRVLGVEPHWLGLCLVPASLSALCAGMALARREQPAHGYALAAGALLAMAAACLHALASPAATDVSRGLTLGAASASLFAVRWIFDERRFSFGGAALLAAGALCWLHLAGMNNAGIAAGEAALALVFVGAGSWRTRVVAQSPLALSGLALSALVTLGLPAFGGRFLSEPSIAGTLAACLVLAALHAVLVARTRVTEFTGAALLNVSAAWCVAVHWAGFSAPEIFTLGPALCLAGLGAFELKVRDVLWPREFTPNLKMALGLALFFVPLMAPTLDLKHGWEVAMVFVAAVIVCIGGVALKLRMPLRGGLAAALFALLISLLMVIPFSRMGFGWWIGIASTLLILTGIALEKRINGWLRSNVQQARLRFAAAFAGWQ